MPRYFVPVDSILWARPIEKPSFIPINRPRGSKAAGLRYERAFAKFLKPNGCIHGQWFEFEDKHGIRYCQTDVLYPISRRLMAIVEAKYTLVDHASEQLLDLYGPVVSAAYNIPVGLVTVFKNVGRPSGRLWLHNSLEEAAVWSSESGEVAMLQWMGQPITASKNTRTAGILDKIKGGSHEESKTVHR